MCAVWEKGERETETARENENERDRASESGCGLGFVRVRSYVCQCMYCACGRAAPICVLYLVLDRLSLGGRKGGVVRVGCLLVVLRPSPRYTATSITTTYICRFSLALPLLSLDLTFLFSFKL